MNNTWSEAFRDKRFTRFFILSAIGLALIALLIQPYFSRFIANKPGVQLNDWVLNAIPAADHSLSIFFLVYTAVLGTIFMHFRNPEVMVMGMATYTLVTWVRLLTIWIFTLEAPEGLIDLSDPFLSLVVYSSPFTKDLFFSGHASTMMVMVLIEPRVWIKWIKAFAMVILCALLLRQHIHYTVDVVLALPITYGIWRLVKILRRPPTN